MRGPKYSLIAVLAMGLVAGGVACLPKPSITIQSPAHGAFTTAANVTLSGIVKNVSITQAAVRVNGTPSTLNANGTWSITMPLDAAKVVNPFMATLVRVADNQILARQRIVVHAGSSRADGAFSEQGVALRINDTGLDQIEPLIESQVDFDLAALLPVGTTIINNQCMIDGGFLGCLGRATVKIASPPPSISGFGLDLNSQTNFVDGDITVNGVRVDVNIDGSGSVPDCGLRLTANSVFLPADYALQPDAVDPSNIDVNLIAGPNVSFSGFTQAFTSGVCDWPIIGDIIQLIVGDVQPMVTGGLQSFLADPDGAGPADSPLAEAFEVALADISITGPLGEALGVMLEAPLFAVLEDTAGITLDSNTRVQSSVGTGPGQCDAPPGAPDLAASYHVAESFPAFGATTPVGGLPYDLGIAISTSAFNQLLKAQIECGLLQVTITEFDFGSGPLPLTAGTLALLVPEFQNFPPATPLRIELRPTLAPLLTGNNGPGGELGEIRVGQIEVTVIGGEFPLADTVFLKGAVDFRAGLNMTFDDETGSLVVGIGSVTPADITVGVLDNPVNTNEATLGIVLPGLLAFVLPDLGQGLGAFPIPSFLGLQLSGVEVSRNGQFYSLFTNLDPAP